MPVMAEIKSQGRKTAQGPGGRRRALAALAGLAMVPALSGFTFLERYLAPKASLWPRWSANDPASRARVDHEIWDRFLGTYVKERDGRYLFDYAAVSAPDRAQLKDYLARLSEVPVSRYHRREQFAFWVNLYNALTVDVVLAHYPLADIRDIDISPGLFDNGPWDAALITVEQVALSLNDIEHRILRPIWRDPRIHYLLNCASLGCPDLLPQAVTAARSEAMRESAARRFVNHPRAMSRSDAGLVVSSIYVWFREDFGDDDQAVIDHLARYADAERRDLLKAGRIAGHRYDWSLNDFTDTGVPGEGNPPS